ncbi:hypothetical protein [Anaerotignum propionicum]|uniref:RyR domain protein n=1 Tax=Anaerotignum propionicum DSM 1682 TaxID=991789 RepID=A0A0X1U943_ANAPI|nr:hypothetical protein [Anaerotignum propionicum]AMJ41434.1 hypothetical protein CPRO_18500 [Anaerotignum propionicum DSM 1682]SHE68288.1 hypothetical protein SAMN02745151_01447 [[Clostridium] propionicum DSM 1682] [Anaerotignum propionicum DSM 1682]
MKRNTFLRNCFLRGLLLVPLILGMVGFLKEYPQEYLNAVYFSLRLYGMEYDLEHITPVLEVARWTALLATFTTLFLTIKSISNAIVIKWKLLYPDTVAIYGTGSAAHYLLEDISQKKIRRKVISTNVFVPAHTHVIMLENDDEAMHFFSENLERFRAGDCVYIQLEDFSPHVLNYSGLALYPFSLSDLTAQLYWRKQSEWICSKCYETGSVKICLIGAGLYGEKMLYFGLLSNIYTRDQSIEYHLFGDWSEYQALHFNWDNIASPGDRVVFHSEAWYQWANHLCDMDMLILCEDDQQVNLHIAQRINAILPKCKFSLRLGDDGILQDKFLPSQITLFGSYNKLCCQEFILQEQLIEDARLQHKAYMQAHPESNIPAWEELDPFTRNSNISSTSFEKCNVPLIKAESRTLNDIELLERLSELEHIRWCRYHYLHNWSYRPGKKDSIHQTHCDLQLYKDLSHEARIKDWQALSH